ncbi:neuropeptide Y receptor type 2 [Callorhinus ursinus]|uniref:Neuropeptide Y receptor type 2 n=2 Tax=Otariidae TaxID=9702 RepID=A0A3Q7PI01_CALUR|nr:neuropeptide Y receptor type 2 [Callorhinus ursinus]XP_027453088.1 neuropeptide Y receptor type 2 [Zalophus californianus]XP_027453089.1 neuropeptide Y receptor type 2 [Zalophus californianus]XP_027960097.1 neuropeptide Y receptor type 2 [Eumetopias jubatus]
MGPVGAEADENQTVDEMKVEKYHPWQTTPRGELAPDPEPELIDSTMLIEVRIILILAYCSIILLGVIGNSLVIHVVIKFKSMRTVTNFFIANLAVADLLVNTLCLPFTLTYTLMGEWKMGLVLCHLVPYAQGLAVQVSTITLTVIALDRHRCIVYHLESKISKRISFLIIGMAWGISALLASPLAIFREYSLIEIIPDFEIVVCTEKWPGEEKNIYGTVYSLSSLLILYVLPLGIISFSYTRIWSKLKNHMSPGASNDHYHQRRQKTTKMLVCVVVVFAVSWLPLHAFQLAVDIDNHVLDLKEYKLIFTVFHIIAMCSTFANPLLYGWMNSNYRKAFLAAFHCEQRLDAIHSEVSVTFKTKKNLEVKKNNGPQDSFTEATSV